MLDLKKLIPETAAKKAKKAPAKKKAAAKKAPVKKTPKIATDGMSPARKKQIDRAAKAGVELTADELKMTTSVITGLITKKIEDKKTKEAYEKAVSKAPVYFAIAIISGKRDTPPYHLKTVTTEATGEDMGDTARINLVSAAIRNLPDGAKSTSYIMTVMPKGRSSLALPLLRAPDAFRTKRSLTASVKKALAAGLIDPTKSPLNFPKSLISYIMRSGVDMPGIRQLFPDGTKIGLKVKGPVMVVPVFIRKAYWDGVSTKEVPEHTEIFEHLRMACSNPTKLAQKGRMVRLDETIANIAPAVFAVLKASAQSVIYPSEEKKALALKVEVLRRQIISRSEQSPEFKNHKDYTSLINDMATLDRNAYFLAHAVEAGANHSSAVLVTSNQYDVMRAKFQSMLNDMVKSESAKKSALENMSQNPAVDAAGVAIDPMATKKADPLKPKAVKTRPTSVPTVPADKTARDGYIDDTVNTPAPPLPRLN
jgi:hypothetical protein